MPDSRDDLRATEESLIEAANRVAHLEHEKLRRDLGDPRLANIAREVEVLARDITDKASAERELVEETRRRH